MKNRCKLLFLLIGISNLISSDVLSQEEIKSDNTISGVIIPFNSSNFRNLENVLLIRVSGNGYADETIIRFLPLATENFDPNYDAWKIMSSNSQVPSIFTELADSSKISINALPELNKDWFVPVYLKIDVPGQYLIEIEELGAFDSSFHLYLKDHLSNNLKNLKNVQQFNINVSQQLDGNAPAFELYAGLPIDKTINDASCYNVQDGSVWLSKAGSKGFSYIIKDTSGNNISSETTTYDSITVNSLTAGYYEILYTLNNGFIDTVSFNIVEPPEIIADFSLSNSEVAPTEIVGFFNNSQNANSFSWNFGDGTALSNDFEPLHEYFQEGEYNITLTASTGNCNATFAAIITVAGAVTGIQSAVKNDKVTFIYSKDIITVMPDFDLPGGSIIKVYNMAGQVIKMVSKSDEISKRTLIDTSYWNSGMYLVSVETGVDQFSGKIIKP